ncbi:MAG: hypothetical protein Q9185_000515 [Variospora sp. 1 TL-2023]
MKEVMPEKEVPEKAQSHEVFDASYPVFSGRDPPIKGVPIPFSVFPSSYANTTTEDTTRIRVEGEANLPRRREDQETRYSSFQATLPNRQRTDYEKDELKVHAEDHDRRHTRREENVTVYEEDRHHQRDRFPEVELSRQR